MNKLKDFLKGGKKAKDEERRREIERYEYCYSSNGWPGNSTYESSRAQQDAYTPSTHSRVQRSPLSSKGTSELSTPLTPRLSSATSTSKSWGLSRPADTLSQAYGTSPKGTPSQTSSSVSAIPSELPERRSMILSARHQVLTTAKSDPIPASTEPQDAFVNGNFCFKWEHPASEVYVTGTFDNWGKTHKLYKNSKGVFQKFVEIPTSHKIYYKFVVDGNWVTNHTAPQEADDSGNLNNVLTLDRPLKHTDSRSVTSAVAPQPQAQPLPLLKNSTPSGSSIASMSNNWRTPATSRQSARAAKPATMAQKPGAPVRKPTAAAKVTKKDGADDSDSDEDSDDLMAMMIAASLVAQSEGRGGRPGSSDGPSGLEALLLGAMLARAKQKRESEAEKNKSAEEKKGKERLERKEEAEKRDRVGADRREAARAAPRGPSHIESFAEWIARREREKSEKTTESTNPFRMTPASTSTARESGKTEIPQKGPKFKVPPRPQAQASPPSSVDPFRPRPTTMVTDQPTLQVPPAPKELSKPLAPPVAKKATEPTSKPVPAPTPYKRTGPKFKVPPLSAAQKKPE